jgi:hypothetical protein
MSEGGRRDVLGLFVDENTQKGRKGEGGRKSLFD